MRFFYPIQPQFYSNENILFHPTAHHAPSAVAISETYISKKKKSNLKALGQLLSVPKKLELGTKHVNI